MLKLTKVGRNNISESITKVQEELNTLPAKSLDKFKELTPVRSGNARRKTKLRGNEIEADYPYANRLNEGWSRQAPDGIETPFMKWVSAQVKKILRKR